MLEWQIKRIDKKQVVERQTKLIPRTQSVSVTPSIEKFTYGNISGTLYEINQSSQSIESQEHSR
ncbi:hypothetical protein DOY81_004872 [Sarcophaga bullata]|nr:hypothetical protein DOY81_004872 [Sarcophaga bullata]